MIMLGGKLNSNYGWEIALFHKIRPFSDGISIFTLKINIDRYLADHSPRFEFHFILINHTIIEFNVYYLHHRDAE